MSLYLTDDKSTLVQVLAWCCQATSYCLSQCWPRSLSPYGVTRPQWINTSYWNYKVHRQQKLCEQWQTWLNILYVAPRPLWFILVVKMDIFAMVEYHWKCTCMPCWKHLPFIISIYEQDSIVPGDALMTIVCRPSTIEIQHTYQGYPGYFQELHWKTMGLLEISRVTWQLWSQITKKRSLKLIRW